MRFALADVVRALEDAALPRDRLGDLPTTANGITDDSRTIQPGTVFVAVRGTERDGHAYLGAAHAAGAVAAIIERPPPRPAPDGAAGTRRPRRASRGADGGRGGGRLACTR